MTDFQTTLELHEVLLRFRDGHCTGAHAQDLVVVRNAGDIISEQEQPPRIVAVEDVEGLLPDALAELSAALAANASLHAEVEAANSAVADHKAELNAVRSALEVANARIAQLQTRRKENVTPQ